MAIERRHFIKSGFAGLSAGLLSAELTRGQSSSGRSKGVLEGGTSSVHLEGRLKSGVLTVEAREFTEGDDRCVIINGKLVDAKLSSIDLYCSFFSYKLEQSVFMILRSNGHSTSVLLSNSDDPQIAHLVVWNDVEPPGTFRVDKDKFMDTQKFKEAILDGKGESLDLVGKRNPPAFTMNELESVFHDNEARNEFMRGRRPHPTVTAGEKFYAFDCAFLSSIFGSLVKLFWIVG